MNFLPRVHPGMTLPNQEFFEPTPYGLEWLTLRLYDKKQVFEVGCGTGKLTAALHDKDIKVIPIDVAFREAPHTKILVMDALDFLFPEGSWLLVCRPNRGFVPLLLQHAEECRCAGLIYIGKEEHVEDDLDGYKHPMIPYDLSEELGKEGETAWEVRFRRHDKADGIKACIILDPMGSTRQTPEQEAVEIQENYEEILGRPLNVRTASSPHNIEVGTEIVFFDYGGMMPGCGSLVEDNSRELLRWAQDHPSALVVVVSSFTYSRYIQHELAEMFPDGLHNLVHEGFGGEGAEGIIPEWFTASLKPIIKPEEK